jgi:amidophosphoribosyltransferase
MYQDLKDLEDSVKEVPPVTSRAPELTKFESSCFSGEYVTGESIGDEYFKKLYALRSDEAKEKKKRGPMCMSGSDFTEEESSPKKGPQQSDKGCETLQNDTTVATDRASVDDACESLLNNSHHNSIGLVN